MKLLVLGGTGQLGREVLRLAAERTGVTPATLDRDALDLSRLDAIEAALAAAVPFDVLVNCAAWTGVDDAESEAGTAFAINAYAVERIARACRRSGARLVHISTDYVFDGEADRPYREDDAPGPINVYGASKLAGERLALREHRDGTLIVRTSSVFGHGRRNFVETMIRLAGERDRLRVVDDIVMAPTYTVDLARAILELVEAGDGGVYHVTNRGSTSWYDFARAALEAEGLDTPVDPVPAAEYPTAARRPMYSVLDTEKADAVMAPLPDWRDALSRYLEERPRRTDPERGT